MRRPGVLFPIALALGATILVPGAVANVPTRITVCQTIDQPGSYVLANNLTANGDCLVIASPQVTIDLAGFSISGNGQGTGIKLVDNAPIGLFESLAFAVRNGTITGFNIGVDVAGFGSIIEGLRVFQNQSDGIHNVNGIIRGNIVFGNGSAGIVAEGTITGNYSLRNGGAGIHAGGTISDNFSNGDIGGGYQRWTEAR
jgi:hypothetical protein